MAISFNAAALLNGNGIDVKSVVNAILNQQTGPLVDWQNQQTDLSTQAGLLAKSISFASDHSGGTVMPFLISW